MIRYIKGDLLKHIPETSKVTILAHSCNCRGSWGAGVAYAFSRKFPSAYKTYNDFCRKNSSDPASLLGTSLLIESSPGDVGTRNGIKYYIACLFTSDDSGAGKLPPAEILKNTDTAVKHLQSQIHGIASKEKDLEMNETKVVLNIPCLNAGLFEVPWEDTEAVLKKHEDFYHYNVYIL